MPRGQLRRVTAPGGLLAVTDTDWATLAIDHPDPTGAAHLAAAAMRWVAHPTLARSLPRRLAAGGAAVVVRADAGRSMPGPGRPDALDGPPGLPLRALAATAAPDQRGATEADVDALANGRGRGASSPR